MIVTFTPSTDGHGAGFLPLRGTDGQFGIVEASTLDGDVCEPRSWPPIVRPGDYLVIRNRRYRVERVRYQRSFPYRFQAVVSFAPGPRAAVKGLHHDR